MEKLENIVASYARVSTDKDEQEMSFESQMLYFKDEVEKAGLVFYKAYGDKGVSGTKLNNREQFNLMLYDAGIDIKMIQDKETHKKITYYICSTWRKPKFGQIWIKSTSRFARNTFSFELIQKLRENNVYIRFLLNNIYTKDPAADMQLKLLQTFDENESRTRGDATRWGFQRGAEKGRVYCGGNLFGYDYNPKDNTLRKNKDAETVRYIYDLYLSGKGIRVIRNILSEKNIKSPTGKDKWGYTSLKNMLKNEKYAGLNNACKFDSGRVLENKHYSKPKPDYIVQETDKIDAIISQEEFYKVRDIMRQKCDDLNNPTKGKRKAYSKYAGVIYCKYCGKFYIRNSDYKKKHDKSSKYFFYCCSTKRKEGVKVCSAHNITETQVDKTVKDICKHPYKYFEEMRLNFLKVIAINALKQSYFMDYPEDEDNPYTRAISSEQEPILRQQLQEATLHAIREQDPNLKAAYQNAVNEINKELTALQIQLNKDNDTLKRARDTIEIYKNIKTINKESFNKTYSSYEELEDIISSFYISDKDQIKLMPIFNVFAGYKDIVGEEDFRELIFHLDIGNDMDEKTTDYYLRLFESKFDRTTWNL